MEGAYRPFTGKRWLRGNLHTHSNRSDGHFHPARVAMMYKRANYDFVAISDHRIYGDFSELSDPEFLVIPAGEFNVNSKDGERTPANPTKTYHILFILADPDSPNRLHHDAKYTPENEDGTFLERVQKLVDWGNETGNLVIMSHPNSARQYEDSSLPLTGFTALEIHNNTSHFSEGIGRSEHHWDALLRAGKKIWGVAVDDGHMGADYYGGWIMVSADELSIPSIAQAIRTGSFYSTTGPLIHDLYAENGKIHVSCTPCERIRFVQYEERGKMVRSSDGTDSLTEAEMTYAPSAKFVRVECIARDGSIAWSNPIFINEPGQKRPASEFPVRLNPEKEVVPLIGQEIPTVGMAHFTQKTPLRNGKHYKGCIHAHTTRSDGKLDAADLCKLYREKGYDFLSITDHRIYTNTTAYDREDFLVLPGVELDVWCGSFDHDADDATRQYTYHINGILADYKSGKALPDGHVWERPVWSPEWETTTSLREKAQEIIDFLRDHGNLVMLNHPQWSGNLEKDVYGFPGLFAMEIYNHGAEISNANGFSEHFYSYCLRNNMKLWQTATDDTHGIHSAGGGWIVVSAPEFTKEAIADAMAKGHFYSSTGPVIHDFWLDENGIVRLTCEPAKSIEFFMPYTVDGWAIRSRGTPVTKGSYTPEKGEMVMARVTDFTNKVAWTNPILVE